MFGLYCYICPLGSWKKKQATEKKSSYMTFGRRLLVRYYKTFRQRQSCRSYTQYSPFFLLKETFREMFKRHWQFFFSLSYVSSQKSHSMGLGSSSEEEKKVHEEKKSLIFFLFVVYHSLKSFVRREFDKGWNYRNFSNLRSKNMKITILWLRFGPKI